MFWIPSWSSIPEFKRECYFKDLVEKLGDAEVYKGTGVDTTTQASLDEYFKYDFLCDTEERFLWLWRRALLEAYPVYIDQMEAWKRRKTYDWYFDNTKDKTTTHDGTFKLDEDTKAELLRDINRALSDVAKTILDTDTTDTRDARGTSHTDTDENTNGTSQDTGKNRQFAFNYPESNYSGGVIPYDIDNNPSVEFISTQADGVNKSNNQHEDTSTASEDGKTTSTESAKGTVDTTTDYTDKQDETTKQTENQTASHGQETATHWTETTTYKGDSLNALARELIDMLPATDFFSQFVGKLKKCFMNDFLFDEVEEGL